MKTINILSALLAVAPAGILATSTPTYAAASAKVIAFKGNYSGTASLLINGTSVTIQSVTGTGSASVVGAGSVSAKGSAAGSSTCVPFKGTGSMKGSGGTIKFSVSASNSQGCTTGQSGPVTVTVTGKAKVTGGTGKAMGAKGTLSFSGTLNLKDTTGAQMGTFTGKLSGKLTISK